MGHRTEATIEAWQKAAGIKPATGNQQRVLDAMSEKAFELIKMIALERSGIRDGDGQWLGDEYWHGSEPFYGLLKALSELNSEYLCDALSQSIATPMMRDALRSVKRSAPEEETPF